jgi:hypothetical protein
MDCQLRADRFGAFVAACTAVGGGTATETIWSAETKSRDGICVASAKTEKLEVRADGNGSRVRRRLD